MKKSALYLLENFLVLFTGVILGAVLVSACVGSFWKLASDMGALFGGIAAVLLIIVGWIKADEWKDQHLYIERRQALFDWHAQLRSFADMLEFDLYEAMKSFSSARSFFNASVIVRGSAKADGKDRYKQNSLGENVDELRSNYFKAQNEYSHAIKRAQRSQLNLSNVKARVALNKMVENFNEAENLIPLLDFKAYSSESFTAQRKSFKQKINQMRNEADRLLLLGLEENQTT